MGTGTDGVKYSGRAAAFGPAERVDVALGPSPVAERFLTAMAGATLALVLWTPMPPAVKAMLVPAVTWRAIAALRCRARQEGPDGVRGLRLDRTGAVQVAGAEGASRVGRVLDGSFVAPWLTIMHWLPDGARLSRTVVIVADMVEADAFRRLRVLLRWS